MRTDNDIVSKHRLVPVEPVHFLVCVALNCVFAALIVGSPFAVLYSHRVLPHFGAKIASILGLGLAGVVFNSPPELLILMLAVGFVFVDCVDRCVSLNVSLLLPVGVSIVGLLLLWGVSAALAGQSVVEYWKGFSEVLASRFLASMDPALIDPGNALMAVRYQLPGTMLAMVILSIWGSIGIGAHLAWFGDNHPLSSNALRGVLFGNWVWIGPIVTIVGKLLSSDPRWVYVLSGVETVFLVVLFCQGCIAFSNILGKKGVSRGARTVWYVAFGTIGFYGSILFGTLWMLSPKVKRLLRGRR